MSEQELAIETPPTGATEEFSDPVAADSPSSTLPGTGTLTGTGGAGEATVAPAEEVASVAPSEDSTDAMPESPAESAETEETDGFSIYSLKPGTKLTATVKNIVGFGAFVDIGLPQDGLVHISELSRRKVEKVTDVVTEGQVVDVWVKRVDIKRGRISLTMKKPIVRRFKDIKEGDEFEGVVTRLEPYGAFVDIDSDREGLVHISQITHEYINHPEEALTIGQKVPVKVIKINRKKRQVDLSIKAMLPPPPESEKPEPVKSNVEQPRPEKQRDEEPDESLPTAMAIAFASFQKQFGSERVRREKRITEASQTRKQELDSVISQTLTHSE